MEGIGLSELVNALNKGGPVVALIIVWVAMRAMRSAEKAVDAISEIRDHVVGFKPVIAKTAESVEDMARSLDDIDSRTSSIDLKLTAALARSTS